MSAIQQGQQAVVQGAIVSAPSTAATNTRSWARIVAKDAHVKIDMRAKASTTAKVDSTSKVNTSATVETPSKADAALKVVDAPVKVNALPFQRKLNGNQRRKVGRQLNGQASTLASTEAGPSDMAKVRSKHGHRPHESSSKVSTQGDLDNGVERITPFVSAEAESQVGASSAGSPGVTVQSRLDLVNRHDDPIVALNTRAPVALPPTQQRTEQEPSVQVDNTVHEVTSEIASPFALQLDNASQENLFEDSKSKKKAQNKKKNERRKSKKQAEKLAEEQEAAFLLSAQASALAAAVAAQVLEVNEAIKKTTPKKPDPATTSLAQKSSTEASTEPAIAARAISSSFPCSSTFEPFWPVHPKGYNFGFSVMDNTQPPRLSSGLNHASSSMCEIPTQSIKFKVPQPSFAPSLATSASKSMFNAPQHKTADPIHQTGQPASRGEDVPLASNDAHHQASEQRPASITAAAAPTSGSFSVPLKPECSKPAAPDPGLSTFRANTSTTSSDQDLDQGHIENTSPEVSRNSDTPDDDETSDVTAPCKEEAAAAFVRQVEQVEGLESHNYPFMDGAFPNVPEEFNIRDNVLFFLSEQADVEYPNYMADAQIIGTSTSGVNQVVDSVEDVPSEQAHVCLDVLEGFNIRENVLFFLSKEADVEYPDYTANAQVTTETSTSDVDQILDSVKDGFFEQAHVDLNFPKEFNIRENVLFFLSKEADVEYPDYMANAKVTTETSISDVGQIVNPVKDVLFEQAHVDFHVPDEFNIRKNVLFFLSTQPDVEYPDYTINTQFIESSTSDVDVLSKQTHVDIDVLDEFSIRENVFFFLSKQADVEYPDYTISAQIGETLTSDADYIVNPVEDATSIVAMTGSVMGSTSISDTTQAGITLADDDAVEQQFEGSTLDSDPPLSFEGLPAHTLQPYEYPEDDRVDDPTMPQNRPDTAEEMSGVAVPTSPPLPSKYSSAQTLQVHEYAEDDRVPDPTMPQNRPDNSQEMGDVAVPTSPALPSKYLPAQTPQDYEYAEDDRVHDPTMPQNRPNVTEELGGVKVSTSPALPSECLTAQALQLYEYAEDERVDDPTMPQNRPDTTEEVSGGATPNFSAGAIASPLPDNLSETKDAKGQDYTGKASWVVAYDEDRIRHARNTSVVSIVSTSSSEGLKSVSSVTSMDTDPECPSSDPVQDWKVDTEASPLSLASPPAKINEASSSSRVNFSTCLRNEDRTQSGRNQSATAILQDPEMVSKALRRANNTPHVSELGSSNLQSKGIETRELKRYFGPTPSWLGKHGFKAAKAAATVAIIPADLTMQATLVPVKVAKTGFLVGRWACARFGPRWLQWLVGA